MTTHTSSGEPRSARRLGYLAAILFNLILLVIVNVVPGWQTLPFLTEDFASILWLINLPMVANALVNVSYLRFDPAWFKSACQFGVYAIGMAATVRMLQVFPFDFSESSFPWAVLVRVLLVLSVVGSVVAILTELVRLMGQRSHTRAASPHAGPLR